MPFQIRLGATEWDAVRYCRSLTDDLYTPFSVSDQAYMAYAEDVAEDFARWVPLDIQIGDPVLQASAFATVANQQRYLCDASNGFTEQVSRVTDVLYRASDAFSAASEIAYLALLPFSPVNRFLFTPSLLDSPSERILRDEYLSELDHYGRGYAGVVRDATTGTLAIDLYPTPAASGIPVYARYQTVLTATPADPNDDAVYLRVPENYKRQFARLLYALVLETEATRAGRATSTEAGILRGTSDPQALAKMVSRVRNEVYQQLGAAVPAVAHTF